jgi:GT2 family glycosyltransferase
MVLNWNGQRYLGACLTSVLADACQHVEVILVDNGSIDDSVEWARNNHPEIGIIRHPTNLGFSAGYNAAVPGSSGEILVFLNNDTVVERGWLTPLVDRLREDSRTGIATSKIVFFGKSTINAAGGQLKLWTGPGELGYGRPGGWFDDRRDVVPFFASGASMAIPRWLFTQLGGFEKGIFAYGEDVDLSWRARLRGYKIAYVPESIVQHHHSGTLQVFNPSKVRMVTRGYMIGMIKCLSVWNLIHSLPAYAMFAFLKGLALSIVKRNPSYSLSVLLSFADILRAGPGLLEKRRATQITRILPDSAVLRSEGFGLFNGPSEFLRILTVAQESTEFTSDVKRVRAHS